MSPRPPSAQCVRTLPVRTLPRRLSVSGSAVCPSTSLTPPGPRCSRTLPTRPGGGGGPSPTRTRRRRRAPSAPVLRRPGLGMGGPLRTLVRDDADAGRRRVRDRVVLGVLLGRGSAWHVLDTPLGDLLGPRVGEDGSSAHLVRRPEG